VEITRNRDSSLSSESSEVLLSEIPGGCGRVLTRPEFLDSKLVIDEEEIWCGMAYKALEGYYFVCLDCI